ncbi:MAG: EthD domain-containing protein [Oceanospirillaceae bacterium]|nr:EthD domain-containing protein [Oceanospirillaceae bacterium]
MEKLVYLVWGDKDCRREALRNKLLSALEPVQQQSRRLTLCVADDAVLPAEALRQDCLRPSPDAFVHIWVDSAFRRAPLEQALHDTGLRFAGYLVTESEPLVVDRALERDTRVPGMCQTVCLTRPPRLSEETFFDIWLNSHTQVAIDTQSTFGYRQNVIARPLTYGAPPLTAIIEENFPTEAMSSQHAFFDAADDDQLNSRQQAMIDSCVRFIDFDKIDVVPTSEYRLK